MVCYLIERERERWLTSTTANDLHKTKSSKCTIQAPYNAYTLLSKKFVDNTFFQLLMVVWCMYGACMVHVWCFVRCMYGACMVHFGPLRTISQRCTVHVWCISYKLEQFLSLVRCIHDHDYIQRRTTITIRPFQTDQRL